MLFHPQGIYNLAFSDSGQVRIPDWEEGEAKAVSSAQLLSPCSSLAWHSREPSQDCTIQEGFAGNVMAQFHVQQVICDSHRLCPCLRQVEPAGVCPFDSTVFTVGRTELTGWWVFFLHGSRRCMLLDVLLQDAHNCAHLTNQKPKLLGEGHTRNQVPLTNAVNSRSRGGFTSSHQSNAIVVGGGLMISVRSCARTQKEQVSYLRQAASASGEE